MPHAQVYAWSGLYDFLDRQVGFLGWRRADAPRNKILVDPHGY
jgi:hypothetical protein